MAATADATSRAARFAGRVVFVTGGASGMGRAACVRFASEGARVYAVDIDEAGLAETAKLALEAAAGVPEAEGAAIETARCDVGSPEACKAAVEACVAAFGRLDVLCNVAGIAPMKHMTDTTPEDWDRVNAINLRGPFFLSQAAVPHLLETKGNIVNISSIAGLKGQAYTVAYCATKGGLVHMTKAMAMEYVKREIRVNCICPGGTKSNLTSGMQIPEDVDFKLMKPYAGFRAMSEPEEIAASIAFIASDEASSIHGAVLSVDGGNAAG